MFSTAAVVLHHTITVEFPVVSESSPTSELYPHTHTKHQSSQFSVYLPHLVWSLSKRGHKGKDELDFIFYQIFCTGHATLISTTLSGSGQLPEAGCVLCI